MQIKCLICNFPDSYSPHNGGEGSDTGGSYLKAADGDKCQGQDKRAT